MSFELPKAFRVAMILALALLSRQSLSAQRSASYEVPDEQGLVEVSYGGLLSWQLLNEKLPEYVPILNEQLPIAHVLRVLWTGYERRFLVMGMQADRQLGMRTILLLDMERDPERIELLATARNDFNPSHIAYSEADRSLFLYDSIRQVVFCADFQASAGKLPARDSFTDVIDGTQLAFGWPNKMSYARLDGELSFDSSPNLSYGLYLGGIPTGEFHLFGRYRLLNPNGRWQAFAEFMAGIPFPGRLSVSNRDPLIAELAESECRIYRLGPTARPGLVSEGRVEPLGRGSSGGFVDFPLPSAGLVPGERYSVVNPEELEALATLQNAGDWEGGSIGEFKTYDITGRSFRPDDLRLGSFQIMGRSAIGNREMRVFISVGSVGADWAGAEYELSLLWAMGKAGGEKPLEMYGEWALLKPLGGETKDLGIRRWGASHYRLGEWSFPMVDERLEVGDLLYLQVIARSGEDMALSEVFATTIFPAREGAEFEVTEGGEMPDETRQRWEEAKLRLVKEKR